ncbi:MAG: type II toxin-antitoxin system VapC family toxin [Acidimicrobiales bacterium]
MIVCDTGVLVGAADADDAHHSACVEVFARHGDELIVPASVVVEACWLLARFVSVDSEAHLLESVAAGTLAVEPLVAVDYDRAAALVRPYADLGLGVVDATVVAVAECLRVTELATLDHRDFSVVRPAHTAAFTLLP